MQKPDTAVTGGADIATEFFFRVAVIQHPFVGVVVADRTDACRRLRVFSPQPSA